MRRAPARGAPWTTPSVFVPPASVPLPLVLVLRGEDEELVLRGKDELAAVEEQRRRTADPRVGALLLVPLDHAVEPARVGLLEHVVAVEADLPRMLLQRAVAEILLIGEEQVVQGPEPALLPGELGRRGGDLRAGMHGKRKVLGAEADLGRQRADEVAQRLLHR